MEWITAEEKQEYDKLDRAAQDYYTPFRNSHSSQLGKNFLKLTQKLMPIRIACAGGPTPIAGENTNTDKDGNPEEGLDGQEVDDTSQQKVRKAKQQKFSDFAFTSKVKCLIQELTAARDRDPTSKSLVFSQFNSSLKYLQQELPKHGFQFRSLSGDMSMKKRAKALSDFQKDPPTTIFLLSMRAGAVGINLTQANRVFLLEPCFNPALEKQSIGRVYRLVSIFVWLKTLEVCKLQTQRFVPSTMTQGQKRRVEIVRLLMKGSVETRMTKMLAIKYGDKTSSAESSPSEASPGSAMVGSVNSDKAVILGQEFDLLFGYEAPTGGRSSRALASITTPSMSGPTGTSGGPQPNNSFGFNDTEIQDILRQTGGDGTTNGSEMETGEL